MLLTQSEYKYVLLNRKCVSYSINRIPSENNKLGTYEISDISLSCFGDKMFILKNGYGGLALTYSS